MSITIPVSYVEQFSANVIMLAEQRTSRLRGTVMHESVTGESWAAERLGGIDAANTVTTLHGDTPLNNTPHSRRWGFITDYDVADLIDKPSKVKLLIDPESKYTKRHAGTMGRSVDDTIITALGGTAATGKAGTGTQVLPSGQKIASSSVGLTLAKLMSAKKILDENEIDEFIPRVFILAAEQVEDLLNDPKLGSRDFNTVQALVEGKVDLFMGFTFIRTERLGTVSSERQCYAYATDGVELGIAAEPSSVASVRPDKRNSMQIYTSGSWGAVRVEDEMVVEILCTE